MHITSKIVSLLSAFLLLGIAASAQMAPSENVGPEVGTVLNMDFAATDQTGAQQNFNSFVGEEGAIIVFYRSAKWCPYCQMQLIDLNTNAVKDIKARGYGLAAISYDKTRDLERFHRKWRVEFPLLSDEGSKMIKALGLQNPYYEEGHYAHGVPYPVILVLDKDKKIVAKLMRESYRERPETEVILETLDSLSAS
jgi:peroxiredoxin